MKHCRTLLTSLSEKSSQPRQLSYYVNKVRNFEWMKNDDSALQAEFKRAQFLVFYDKHPLLKPSTASSRRLSLAWIPHDKLKSVALSRGFSFGPENTALIDTVPMQSQTNDPDEEWLPVLSYGIRNTNDHDSSFPEKLAADLGGGEFVDLRRALFLIDDPTNARLLAKAQALLRWSSSYKFCPKCASPLKLKISKAYAKCTSCEKIYYPTVSPVGMALITDHNSNNLLLVRQPMHVKGMYTNVAGFSEVGENLEETVRREVAEEVGVDIHDMRYMNISQPWPYPQNSLMCGFRVTAENTQQPDVDRSELEDASWFTRDEIKTAFENATKGSFLKKGPVTTTEGCKLQYVPPFGTIAHDLIKAWLSEK